MYYKSNISKTEKKIQRGNKQTNKQSKKKQALSHYLVYYTGPTKPRALNSQFHLSTLCSPLWSHGLFYDCSDICTSSTWMCASSSCFNLIPWQLFLKFWHPTFAVISSPFQTSYFSMDPSCPHLAYSGSMSVLRCSVYCSVSRPCYSIQHKSGSTQPSLFLSLQIDR